MHRFILTTGFILATAAAALAADLDVQIIERGGDGQMANCASSVVSGLKAGGDGFLAVRSGPGTEFRKLDELHNGDVVIEFERRGPWVGVVHGTRNIRCDSTVDRPVTAPRKGWVHGKWLQPLAG